MQKDKQTWSGQPKYLSIIKLEIRIQVTKKSACINGVIKKLEMRQEK